MATMSRMLLAVALGSFLFLLSPLYLQASSPPEDEVSPAALRLAKALDVEGMTLPMMRNLLPSGESEALADLLLKRDETLWRDLEAEYARFLGQSLDEQQLTELAIFFESPLGQAWKRASIDVQEQLLGNLQTGSALRRFMTIGCTVAIMGPRLGPARRNDGSLDPHQPMIDQTKTVCECITGKIVERWGFEGLSRMQSGDEEVVAFFQQILQAGITGTGDCGPWPHLPVVDTLHSKETVSAIHQVGIAMMKWLADQVTDSSYKCPIPESQEGWFMRLEEGAEPAFFSKVSADELEELLVPDYLDALPKVDGWGHPFEFAVNRDLLGDDNMSIRSPGRDGVFEEGPYDVGGFSTEGDGPDHDIVWADGYFVAWPNPE
jgi:hypothetical protein